MKNLQFIGVSVRSYLDMKNIKQTEETYTYTLLDHILTNMPEGGLILISLTSIEIQLFNVQKEVLSTLENHIFLLTDVNTLNYLKPLPHVYAISHYSQTAATNANYNFINWMDGMLGQGNYDVGRHELLYTAMMMLDLITKKANSYNPIDILPLFNDQNTLRFPHGDSILLKERLLSFSIYLLELEEDGNIITKIELNAAYNASNLIANGYYNECYGEKDEDEENVDIIEEQEKQIYEIGYIYCSDTHNVYQSLLISMFLLPIKTYNRGTLINNTYIDPILFAISPSETAKELEYIEKTVKEKHIQFLFGYTCKSGRLPQFDDVVTMNIATVYEELTDYNNQFTFDVYMKALIPFCCRWIIHYCYAPVYILVSNQPNVKQTASLFKSQLKEYGYIVYKTFEIQEDSDLNEVNRVILNHFINDDGTVISLLNDEYLYNYLRSLKNVNTQNIDIIHFGHYSEDLLDCNYKFNGNIFFFTISHTNLDTPVFNMLLSHMKQSFNTTSKQLSQYSINIYNSALFFVESLKKANSFIQSEITKAIQSINVLTATGYQSIDRNNFMTQNIYILYINYYDSVVQCGILYKSIKPFTMTISYEIAAVSKIPDLSVDFINVLLLHSFSSIGSTHDYYVAIAEMSLFDYFNEHTNSNLRIMYHVYDCVYDYENCFINALSIYSYNYIFAGNATLDLDRIVNVIGKNKMLYFEGHFVGSRCYDNVIIGGGLPNQIFTTAINFFINNAYMINYHIFYNKFEPYESYKNVFTSILESNFIYNVSSLNTYIDYVYLDKYLFSNTKNRVLVFLCPNDLFVEILNILDQKSWDFNTYPIFSPFYDSTPKKIVIAKNFYYLGHSEMTNNSTSNLYNMLAQYGAIRKISLREIMVYGTITLFLYQMQAIFKETNKFATSQQLMNKTMNEDITIMDGLKYSKKNSPNWIFQMAHVKSQFESEIITNYNEWSLPEIFNIYYEPGFMCLYNNSLSEKHEYILLNILFIYNNTPNMIDILDMTINELNEECIYYIIY